jgi:hypothetical protein
MIPRALAAACAVSTLAACGHNQKPEVRSYPVAPIRSAVAVAMPARSAVPRFADEAITLVTAYAGRDAAAERLKAGPWFDSVALKPAADLRDSIQIVRYFRVGASAITRDTARVIVDFRVSGTITRAVSAEGTIQTRFLEAPSMQSASFVLVRTGSGWRVLEPPRTMRVFAAAWLADRTLPSLSSADRQRLERTLETQ